MSDSMFDWVYIDPTGDAWFGKLYQDSSAYQKGQVIAARGGGVYTITEEVAYAVDLSDFYTAQYGAAYGAQFEDGRTTISAYYDSASMFWSVPHAGAGGTKGLGTETGQVTVGLYPSFFGWGAEIVGPQTASFKFSSPYASEDYIRAAPLAAAFGRT